MRAEIRQVFFLHFQTSPSTDRSDSDEPELKISCDTSSAYDNWKGLAKNNGNGHPVVGHHLSALLAQNGHGHAVRVFCQNIGPFRPLFVYFRPFLIPTLNIQFE